MRPASKGPPPEDEGPADRSGGDDRRDSTVARRQWAKVPERAAYSDLDATALNVLIILASKAGRDRVAWISQRTVAERLEVHRRTVGHAIRRLERHDLVRQMGTVVVDHERGTWVRKYEVAPYLHDGHVGVPSGLEVKDPMDTKGGPDGHIGGPDGHPGSATFSSSVLSSSKNSDAAASSSPKGGSPPVDGWAQIGAEIARAEIEDGVDEADAHADAFLRLAKEWVKTPPGDRETKTPLGVLRAFHAERKEQTRPGTGTGS
jgi:hypothetical protein